MNWTDIVTQLPKHPTLTYETRDVALIDGISVHNSADMGSPWSWAEWHINGNGWPGVAYHAGCMADGKVFKLNNDSTMSYHTKSHNHHLIGICLQGDFANIHQPTEPQLRGLLWVVRKYMAAYPRITPDRIRGHRDWQSGGTTCPGTWLPEFLRVVLANG